MNRGGEKGRKGGVFRGRGFEGSFAPDSALLKTPYRKYGPFNGGERCFPEVSERKRSENWIFVGYRELTDKY